MDGDICRICDHRVIDLTAWTDAERIAFVANQTDDVCISYRLPVRPALAAAALAAAALPTLAVAQDAPPPPATAAPATAAPANDGQTLEFVGSASRIDHRGDRDKPVLITVTEPAPVPVAPVEAALAAIPVPVTDEAARRAVQPPPANPQG